jgi:hypothetical protein
MTDEEPSKLIASYRRHEVLGMGHGFIGLGAALEITNLAAAHATYDAEAEELTLTWPDGPTIWLNLEWSGVRLLVEVMYAHEGLPNPTEETQP